MSVAGRRVLVTGASGFVGSHVVGRLVEAGAEVSAMATASASSPPPRLAVFAQHLRVLRTDIRDAAAVRAAVGAVAPDLVLHLASLTHVGRSFERAHEHIATNVEGTVHLLQALAGDYDRFVYVGSGDVYGDGPAPFREDQPVSPVSPYAVSKYAAERFCRMYHQAYGWPIVCLRPFNSFGPGQSVDRVIPELIVAGLQGRSLPMTEGRQTREFTFVTDIAEALVRALTVPDLDGEVLNLCRGEEVSMRALALLVAEVTGSGVEPAFGALPHRPNEIWRMVGDPTRTRERLGWEATVSLEEGLVRTTAWYRDALVSGQLA